MLSLAHFVDVERSCDVFIGLQSDLTWTKIKAVVAIACIEVHTEHRSCKPANHLIWETFWYSVTLIYKVLLLWFTVIKSEFYCFGLLYEPSYAVNVSPLIGAFGDSVCFPVTL